MFCWFFWSASRHEYYASSLYIILSKKFNHFFGRWWWYDDHDDEYLPEIFIFSRSFVIFTSFVDYLGSVVSLHATIGTYYCLACVTPAYMQKDQQFLGWM